MCQNKYECVKTLHRLKLLLCLPIYVQYIVRMNRCTGELFPVYLATQYYKVCVVMFLYKYLSLLIICQIYIIISSLSTPYFLINMKATYNVL